MPFSPFRKYPPKVFSRHNLPPLYFLSPLLAFLLGEPCRRCYMLFIIICIGAVYAPRCSVRTSRSKYFFALLKDWIDSFSAAKLGTENSKTVIMNRDFKDYNPFLLVMKPVCLKTCWGIHCKLSPRNHHPNIFVQVDRCRCLTIDIWFIGVGHTCEIIPSILGDAIIICYSRWRL